MLLATCKCIGIACMNVALTYATEPSQSQEHGDLSLLHVRSTTPEDRPRNGSHPVTLLGSLGFKGLGFRV